MEKMSLSDSRCERIGVDHLFEWLPNDTVRVRSFLVCQVEPRRDE
jgi:hypothetical protein